MAAKKLSGATTRIQHILQATAQHFLIPTRPQQSDRQLDLFASEFKDPLPFRWQNAPLDIAALGYRPSGTSSGLSLSNS
jgi:hypothetical protein